MIDVVLRPHEEAPPEGALQLRQVELTSLVIRMASGAEYSVPLDRLNPEQIEQATILAYRNGTKRNIYDMMNPARGGPSADALALAELARAAMGHPISFERGKQSFVQEGTFLHNYEVDDQFRDYVVAKTSDAQTKQIIRNQYHCGKELLAFTRNQLKRQKQQLQNELEQPDLSNQVKLKLKKRVDKLQKTIEFYDRSIKENAILTAALYPLDLTGLSDTQIKTKLEEQKNRIKEALDSHVVHGMIPIGSDLWNGRNRNYESRNEREGYPFFPIGCSNKSKFDAAREAFAKDIAETALARTNEVDCPYSLHGSGKSPTAESFFIEIQQLAAKNGSQDALHEAILSDTSHLFKAFPELDAKDRNDLARTICHRAVRLQQSGQEEQRSSDGGSIELQLMSDRASTSSQMGTPSQSRDGDGE